MQMVIEISEEMYKDIQSHDWKNGERWYSEEWKAIHNGIPLPRGHGDLKDSNNLKHAFVVWSMAVQGNFSDADVASIIYNSPTIIPADKESEI